MPVDSYTFTKLCELSGLVPLVGVNSGRCFAGNTVMLASCDVIIAAENSTIGLGGPAMIEGGGLGIYTPEEVGPMSFQVPNGVVDILVKDDEAAIETTKKYLSYFQGPVRHWSTPDQRALRHIVPESRSETYDMRRLIETLVDEDSILEIRKAFGVGIITAFIRIEGHPMGLIANNPAHLSGAIDSDAADKGARFLQLCDSFDIPVLSLMDCPGIMPGPDYERAALLRHVGRLFVTGANMTTPMFGVVVRKAYGMGVRAMCGGSSLEPFFTVAWPTAEFADMTIDGRVDLMFGEELEAVPDPEERQTIRGRLIDAHVDRARAVNTGGTNYGVDDVIDPGGYPRLDRAGTPEHPQDAASDAQEAPQHRHLVGEEREASGSEPGRDRHPHHARGGGARTWPPWRWRRATTRAPCTPARPTTWSSSTARARPPTSTSAASSPPPSRPAATPCIPATASSPRTPASPAPAPRPG